MKKLVSLSIVSAVALTLGACGKTETSANVTDNAANEAAVEEGNFAENVTADNVVVSDNAVAALNVTEAANGAEATAVNSN